MSFLDELSLCEPGEVIVYHTGFHCIDVLTERKVPAAAEAWDAYLRGDVLLYQRRVGPAQINYCAKVLR